MSIKIINHTLTACGFLFLLSACSTSYYVPTPNRAPLLQEEKEVTVAASGTLYAQSVSTDVHAAYSPIEGLGLMINGSLVEPQTSRGINNDIMYNGMSGRYIEGAAGYYKKIGKQSSVEIYAGYGQMTKGQTQVDFWFDGNQDVLASFNYNRVFVQSAIGFRGDYFEIIPSLRFSRLEYSNVSVDNPDPNREPFVSVYDGADFFMIEPALNIGFGYKFLKFQVGFGTSFNFQAADFEHDPIFMNFGLIFNLKPIYLKEGFK
jgi:hypothetical protein